MQARDQLREGILASESLDDAISVLAKAVEPMGISRFIAGFVRGAPQHIDGRWRVYKHRSHNFPRGWDEGWHDYNAHCPYYHSCFSGKIAFDWESVRQRNDLSVFERQAWHYLADFGLIEGFTVPVHAPGHFGFLTVVGEPNDRGWATRMEDNAERLLFLAHVFHEGIRERFPGFAENAEEVPLSARERECLHWAAAGKTTEEIALILELSQETVRIYFKRAMQKLGAKTRAQAVARAYGEHLLRQPHEVAGARSSNWSVV